MSFLKDLCKIEYGKALTGGNRIPGSAKVFGSAGEVGSHKEYLYSQPLIVVGRKGNISGVFKVDGPSWVIDTAYALLPSPLLNRDYLYYFLKYHSSQFISRDQSTAVPSLAREVLYTLKLNPPSLDIQLQVVRRIEYYLSEINSGVQKIYATINNLNLYKQSVLNAVIRGRLVSQDPEDELASTLLRKIRAEKDQLFKAGKIKKEKKLLPPINTDEVPFNLPVGWEWARLGDLVYILGGGTPSKNETKYWINADTIWISPKDMKSDYISGSIDKINSCAFIGTAVKKIPKGSLLIVTRSGILQRTIPVAINLTECAINQDIKALVPIIPCMAEYIRFVFRAFEPIFLDTLIKDGVTVQSLKYDLLPLVLIPVPPLNQIQKINSMLKIISQNQIDIVEEVSKAEKLAILLKTSVLKSAFNGELI